MQQVYHIDLGEPGLLKVRGSRWLRVRLRGLFDVPCRLSSLAGGERK